MIFLTCHPESRSDAVRSIGVRWSLSNGALALRYVLEGDLRRVRVPRPGPPRIGADLWKHTCCELFVAREGRREYHELNFSPSGEWAAYAFNDYRDGAPLAEASLDPRIAVSAGDHKLELHALVVLGRLLPRYAGDPLLAGLSAVIEEEERGVLSYWALKHPPGRPDFHHRDAFALLLDEARN